MNEIPTLEVPAELYDEALNFCNERLREQGKPEITELPPGVPFEADDCPCSRACGVLVGVYTWSWTIEGPSNKGGPGRFVRFFDDTIKIRRLTLPIRMEPAR